MALSACGARIVWCSHCPTLSNVVRLSNSLTLWLCPSFSAPRADSRAHRQWRCPAPTRTTANTQKRSWADALSTNALCAMSYSSMRSQTLPIATLRIMAFEMLSKGLVSHSSQSQIITLFGKSMHFDHQDHALFTKSLEVSNETLNTWTNTCVYMYF